MEAAAVGTLGKIKLHLTVEGSWSAVMRTLALSEVLPYKVSISNVDLSSSIAQITEGSTARNVQSWSARYIIEATLIHVE